MKSIVLFYSRDGHTKLVAEQIAKELSCQTVALQPENDYRPGLATYLSGGFASLMGKPLPLKHAIPDLSAYTEIFVGFPVWAGSPAAPINVILQSDLLQGKKVGLFACAGGEAEKALKKARSYLPKDVDVLGTLGISANNEPDTLSQKVENWLGAIVLK